MPSLSAFVHAPSELPIFHRASQDAGITWRMFAMALDGKLAGTPTLAGALPFGLLPSGLVYDTVNKIIWLGIQTQKLQGTIISSSSL